MDKLTGKLETMKFEERVNLYKRVFDSEDAMLVLEDLKNRCYVKTTTLSVQDSETFFNEGMRSVILHIQSQLDFKPGDKVQEEE